MTTTPRRPPAEPSDGHAADRAADRAVADRLLAERATGGGEFLAGLLAAAALDTVGRPDRLPADLFPGLPAEAVAVVWERALAVGFRAGRLAAAPRFHRDTLSRLRGELEAAGWVAMADVAGRAVAVVEASPAHPADGETAVGREHW